ncbi:ParA family protein [Nostoc sp. FACHB-190]|uniref:ParA family protein n=1 Tax=Nostoc sp. FACHB-190 TaxID=2692838 RepID=UPI00168226AD|nr:ParA family protein [Nostoc sp. FACHB-190]MBD2303254.1 ParA family protein [Nostoc sp. FACHB-190]
MSRIIAVFNQAGGVAKTTLTQNLGYQIAQLDYRVLLIDIDPQASLTIFMGLVPRDLDETVNNAIVDERPLPIHESIHGMDLAPANISLATAEMQLVNASMRDFRLREAIEPIQENYDFILIDCPPSLGLLSYISLVAATHVLVPLETHFKAFEGTGELLKTVATVRNKPNRKLQIAGFVPTKYDARNSQDTRTLAAITEQLANAGTIFPPIPRSTAFVDASEERMPLAVYDPKHSSVQILKKIALSLSTLK